MECSGSKGAVMASRIRIGVSSAFFLVALASASYAAPGHIWYLGGSCQGTICGTVAMVLAPNQTDLYLCNATPIMTFPAPAPKASCAIKYKTDGGQLAFPPPLKIKEQGNVIDNGFWSLTDSGSHGSIKYCFRDSDGGSNRFLTCSASVPVW